MERGVGVFAPEGFVGSCSGGGDGRAVVGSLICVFVTGCSGVRMVWSVVWTPGTLWIGWAVG